MDVKRSGSQPSSKGPAEYFTGTVRIDPLYQAPDPARMFAASVTFEPGARTHWHTHPLGQTLRRSRQCRMQGAVSRWSHTAFPEDALCLPRRWRGLGL